MKKKRALLGALPDFSRPQFKSSRGNMGSYLTVRWQWSRRRDAACVPRKAASSDVDRLRDEVRHERGVREVGGIVSLLLLGDPLGHNVGVTV